MTASPGGDGSPARPNRRVFLIGLVPLLLLGLAWRQNQRRREQKERVRRQQEAERRRRRREKEADE